MSRIFGKHQQGTALITVVLIAAVVIVMVVESVKSIRLQKQLSSNLINRDQAYSYLLGMEELAKVWMKKAFDSAKEDTVHLQQPWAQDQITFPLDGGSMSAQIRDMQSCLNLNAVLWNERREANPGGGEQPGTGKEDGSKDQKLEDQKLEDQEQDQVRPVTPSPSPMQEMVKEPTGQLILGELISAVQENTQVTGMALATAVRDWLDQDIEPAGPDGAEDDYYQGMELPYRTGNDLFAHISELRVVKDFDPATYQLLQPYVCVLPDAQVHQINVNTVRQENAALIYATLDKQVARSDIEKALSERGEKGFASVEEFISGLAQTDGKNIAASRLTVTSHWFEMSAQAQIGNTRVALTSLFKRDEKNGFKVVSRYFGRD